mgnify:CR=1 FL=1
MIVLATVHLAHQLRGRRTLLDRGAGLAPAVDLGLDVVLEDDAFGKFRNDAVTLLADLEFLLGLAQGGDVHDDDVEPCAPAFVAYELRLVEQPQDLPVRLGHAVLHGIVVAVHDLAVDGFEHAFAVFRVDEVVEPVAVGFPE